MTDKVEDRGDDEVVIDSNVVVDDKTDLETKVEETPEEKEAREIEEVKAKLTIPKAVFDERIAKARAKEQAERERADKAEATLKAQKGDVDADNIETQIDKLETDLEAAIADNNAEKKVHIRKEIRALNQQLADARAAVHAARATAIAVEQIRYDALINTMETEHPELNPDNEEAYDEDVVAEITDYKEAFEAKGLSSSEALKKALRAVFKPVAKVDKDEKEDVASVASKRKEAAVAAALAAKGKQPIDTKKSGLDSDKGGKSGTSADIAKMSQKEFDKLTPEELSKARGDTI